MITVDMTAVGDFQLEDIQVVQLASDLVQMELGISCFKVIDLNASAQPPHGMRRTDGNH